MIPRLLPMTRQHVEQLTLQHASRQDAVEKIRAVERADELERIVQPELCRNVVSDAGRGGGRVRVDADAWQELTQPRELTVFRSEVVPPLADTVRFIHGDEADRARRQQRQEAVAPFAD